MAGALRELIAFFGVEVDDKPLDASKAKMEALANTARNVAATLGLAFGVKTIFGFVEGQVEAAASLSHTAEMLGMTTEQMQRFDYAASTMGLSADEANNSLRFLNRNIGEAATKGGDGAAAFTKLGVHLKDAAGNVRPTGEVLGEVADGFAKLPSPAVKTAVAMQLFGRAGARMIPFLNQGSAGVAQLNAEFDELGGGMSKDFIEASLKTEHEMAKLRFASTGLGNSVGGALLPAFTWVIEKVTAVVGWFRQLNTHSEALQHGLEALGVALGVITAQWALASAAMLGSVVGFIVAALVIDDVITAAKGGKSVFGDWLDGILGLGATQAVFSALGDWVDKERLVFQSFALDIDNLGLAMSNMKNAAKRAFGGMSESEYNAATAVNTAEGKSNDAKYADLSAQYDKIDAKPTMFSKIDANENAYAQSIDPNGPNQSKQAWWDSTNHNGTGMAMMGGQDGTVPAPAGGAPVTNVTNHIAQTATVAVSVPPGADTKGVGNAAAAGTRKGLRDSHEDTFAAAPTGGGH
jgi:hypothetical protein